MSLVADVFNVLIVKDNGDLIGSTTLSSADIDIKQDSKEIRAGQGDALIAMLHSARDAEIKVSEMTFKKDWIALQLGTSEVVGATTAWATPKFYTAASSTGIKITLDNTPLASNSGIQIFKSDGTLIPSANYTVATNTVTFTTGVAAGDAVEVRGYKYTTSASASTLDINSSSFSPGTIMILETIELREDETAIAKIQYIFDEVLPSGNFSIKTKKERDASAFDFTFKAIKPATSTSLGRQIRIPLS